VPLRLLCKRYGLALLLILIFIILLTRALYFIYGPLINGNTPLYFQLSPGQSTYDVAAALETNGYLKGHERRYFYWLARFSGQSHRLRVGYYLFQPGDSAYRILYKLSHGEGYAQNVTLVDGWTADKVLQVIISDPRLQHSPILLSHEALCNALGLPADASLEGMFWPDSYAIYPGYSDLLLLQRAHRLMENNLQLLWAARESNLPYRSPYEALILASLVEQETASTVERHLIAGVLINRLKANMYLQIDPTVVYALGSSYNGHLTRDNLKIDSPYNTYKRKGLPPTPIALPDLDSLMAVLHPTMSDYLYFVARGDGLHTFSATLAEHNAAVAQYLKQGTNNQ
jgi:UPF0755 protein